MLLFHVYDILLVRQNLLLLKRVVWVVRRTSMVHSVSDIPLLLIVVKDANGQIKKKYKF